jgi:hypothetical protein
MVGRHEAISAANDLVSQERVDLWGRLNRRARRVPFYLRSARLAHLDAHTQAIVAASASRRVGRSVPLLFGSISASCALLLWFGLFKPSAGIVVGVGVIVLSLLLWVRARMVRAEIYKLLDSEPGPQRDASRDDA